MQLFILCFLLALIRGIWRHLEGCLIIKINEIVLLSGSIRMVTIILECFKRLLTYLRTVTVILECLEGFSFHLPPPLHLFDLTRICLISQL